MRQTCPDHGRYRTSCEGCKAARRAYHADLQERRGLPVMPRRSHPRAILPSPGSWAQRGACVDPAIAPHCDRHDQLLPGCEDCTETRLSMFFDGNGRGHTLDFSDAKAICNVCPVRLLCLDHALTVGEAFGVWGGTTEEQRRRMRRRRKTA